MKRAFLQLLLLAAVSGSALAQSPDADNMANNKKANESVTAGEQSNDPADIKITADIRKAVVADDSLSALAKNVKIITISNTVTLRGPVESEKEKATIVALAKKSTESVKDELTVKL